MFIDYVKPLNFKGIMQSVGMKTLSTVFTSCHKFLPCVLKSGYSIKNWKKTQVSRHPTQVFILPYTVHQKAQAYPTIFNGTAILFKGLT